MSRFIETMFVGAAVALAPFAYASEPGERAAAEVAQRREQAIRAIHTGRAGDAKSAAVRKRFEIERARPAPDGELFALVSVTDRKTKERVYFTRGDPNPAYADYLRHPETAPAGWLYSESDEALADEDVVVVTRSIERQAAPIPAPGLTRDQEEERDLRARNAKSGVHFRLEESLWSLVSAGKLDLSSDALVPVTISVRGLPKLELPKARDTLIGGLLWTGLELEAARETAIIGRKLAVRAFHAGLFDAIERAGGKVRYGSWTSGLIEASVPAHSLESLAYREDVFAIALDEVDTTQGAFDGLELSVATDNEDFEATNSGWNGLSSKHSLTSRILVAIRDQCIDMTNPAWDTISTGVTRANFYDCDEGASCPQGNVEECSEALTSAGWHGTRVAQRVLADFMDGQGSGLTDDERRRLTGGCQECELAFLQDQGLDDRQNALDKACELGADIFSASWGGGAADCDGNGSYDSSLETLVDCDTVWVTGAGNGGSTGACSVTYPASHPWTMAISGIDTNNSDCDEADEWYGSGCQIDTGSSIGPGVYNGTFNAALIDLASPYRYDTMINPGTRNPVTYTTAAGNSYSNPTVSGLTAIVMDWFHDNISDALFFDNRARNFMLLFGDRSKAPDGVLQTNGTTNKIFGAGRVGLVPFDQRPSWTIRRASATLAANASWVHTSNLSTNQTFYKAVVWHDGTDYDAEPRIRVTLNPIGCTTPTISYERSDAKIVVAYDDTPLDGCTSIEITVENLQESGSGTRLFHFAHYAETQDERHY